MTVGSYNVNDISAHASIELNLDVKNKAFAKHTEITLEHIIENDCIPISKEYHIHKKNIVKQFVRWLSFHFIRTVLYLFTFYFKRKE